MDSLTNNTKFDKKKFKSNTCFLNRKAEKIGFQISRVVFSFKLQIIFVKDFNLKGTK